jgi:hypothetical protein
MTLELRSEQPEVQPPCFKPVVTAPRAKVLLRRPNGHERDHAVPELIAANPPVPEIAVTDYESLVEMLRRRADSLDIARSTIDHLARFPDGYTSKILAPNHLRRIGMKSLGDLLDALALKLIPVADDATFARNRSRYVRRDLAHYTSAHKGHDKPGKKFKRISGTITATLFGWPAQ